MIGSSQHILQQVPSGMAEATDSHKAPHLLTTGNSVPRTQAAEQAEQAVQAVQL
jgi:hypothetical protein